jgi:aspartate racemase
MPKIFPSGGEVDWPTDEGVLGVVGVAPWATLQFCEVLYREIYATKDWHFPRVILDINSKLPSRGRHLQLGEADPSPFIAASIRELESQGATVAVVVCNTAHILFDRWGHSTPIPVLNIVDEAVASARRSEASVVVPLTSQSLADYDLYGKAVERAGMTCVRTSPHKQIEINQLIETVKKTGSISDKNRSMPDDMVGAWHDAHVDTVLLGCTELSLLSPRLQSAGFRVVDSNVCLARAALARLRLPRARLAEHQRTGLGDRVH